MIRKGGSWGKKDKITSNINILKAGFQKALQINTFLIVRTYQTW
jgi:hypothetical protein